MCKPNEKYLSVVTDGGFHGGLKPAVREGVLSSGGFGESAAFKVGGLDIHGLYQKYLLAPSNHSAPRHGIDT